MRKCLGAELGLHERFIRDSRRGVSKRAQTHPDPLLQKMPVVVRFAQPLPQLLAVLLLHFLFRFLLSFIQIELVEDRFAR